MITSLPVHGSLSDPNAGAIGAVPYTLASYGDVVTYTPVQYYNGADAFQYVANDGGTPPNGGDSEVANVFVTVGGPQAVYAFPLDSDPGWSVEGEWPSASRRDRAGLRMAIRIRPRARPARMCTEWRSVVIIRRRLAVLIT